MDCLEFIRRELLLTKPQMYRALGWSRQRYHKPRDLGSVDSALRHSKKLAAALNGVSEARILNLIKAYIANHVNY